MRGSLLCQISIALALWVAAPVAPLYAQSAAEPMRAMAADARPGFEVLKVKPTNPEETGKKLTVRGRHVLAVNMNLDDLLLFAYDLNPKQLIGLPKWAGDVGFDLDGVPDSEGRPNTRQLKLLIQEALADRFKLTFHHGQQPLSVFALRVAKGGPKLTETTHPATDLAGFNIGDPGVVTVTNETMKDFCAGLQNAVLDKPVVDQTGLTARYDFRLKWTPDESQFAVFGPRASTQPTDDPSAPPSLSTAMQEQIGLRLESVRAQADVFIVDHVERPTAN